MANVACHNDTSTNHAEVCPGDHWGLETFLVLGDNNILDILHEVKLAEYFKAQHVMGPDVGYQLDLRLPDMEVPPLNPRVNTFKSKVERLRGRKNALEA